MLRWITSVFNSLINTFLYYRISFLVVCFLPLGYSLVKFCPVKIYIKLLFILFNFVYIKWGFTRNFSHYLPTHLKVSLVQVVVHMQFYLVMPLTKLYVNTMSMLNLCKHPMIQFDCYCLQIETWLGYSVQRYSCNKMCVSTLI